MKTVKFLRDWRYSREGDVAEDMGDGEAELLIMRGIVVEVGAREIPVTQGDEDPSRTETAVPIVTTRRVPGPRESRRIP